MTWPGSDVPTRSYQPFSDGKYTVTARMRALGSEPHFQIDHRYPEYVAGKAANWRRAREAYHARAGLSPGLERAIVAFAVHALGERYPEAFTGEVDGRRARLENRLLGLTLVFEDGVVVEEARGPALVPGGEAIFDGIPFVGLPGVEAIALQVQEDLAVVERDASGADRTTAIHVSFPSHWRPQDKVGRSFVEVHVPVPGIEPLSKAAGSIIDMMIARGPWERFTWTLPRTPDLDEHLDAVAARSKPAVPAPDRVGESAWMRVERQVTQGFPEEGGALFFIRLHITPLAEVAADAASAAALASAVRSKWDEALTYKALSDWREVLLDYLDERAGVTSRA